ncbi:hypothetical protein AYL99_01610 [Fonsecaea erecta]|uniref:BTB domain-containing protein n=1 Tax=Fonsecaea erecta TaxID=1367422 RepID=A0A179A0K6_9EURO|nr:hypothetical protein AYL99_01610 [Fonsecaea erecta]OAP65638.1 hypothetical protein AYL99_01610 [Fonsecaea erecta]
MSIPDYSFADSKPFKFLVGPARRAFYMHSRLASQLSIAMDKLLNGDMIEAKEGFAVFEDTDEETFIRVIQFAYTGDYTVAEPDIVLSESDIVVDNPTGPADHEVPVAAVDSYPIEYDVPQAAEPREFGLEISEPISSQWDFNGLGQSRKKKKSKVRSIVWPEDESFSPPPAVDRGKPKAEQVWDSFKCKAHIAEKAAWKPQVNEDHCQDYTPVFLCHAKLYAFADQYSIEPLQDLVLQKLRLTLSWFKLHRQRVGDVVELLKYTYDNTPPHEQEIDRLRNLVSDYLVCHIKKIAGDVKFTELLENSDLVKDFLPKLLKAWLD